MADITKLALIGGGAALLWYEFIYKPAQAVAAPTGTTPTASQTTQQPTTTTNKALIAQVATGVSTATVDQWGFYYNLALGKPAPAPENYMTFDSQHPRDALFTLDQWYALLTAKGLSGVGWGVWN
jgi:hypothetical protein